MKTTKIFFATLLALLCTAAVAQQNSSLLASVKFAPEMNRVETWVYNIHDSNSEEVFARINHPVISQTFYTDYVEISYEEAIFESGPNLEDWMSSPFEFEPVEEEKQQVNSRPRN